MTKAKLNQAGFTLAELLVSLVIIVMIISVVGTTFVFNQRVFRVVSTKAELLQNARIITDLMAREIRQAVSIVTVLPPDNSDPAAVAHELQFEDGHIIDQIQYVRYYLDGTDLRRQMIVYYFETAPAAYVHWDDTDPFGPPESLALEDKLIGEFFSQIDFYGDEEITADLILEKNDKQIEMTVSVQPRNS